jgi:DNA-binding HxlR family transcriptional regulator
MGFIEGSGSREETFAAYCMLGHIQFPKAMIDTLTLEPEVLVARKEDGPECAQGQHQRLLAMGDAMAVLGGKWKIHLIAVLDFKGKRRFSDLLRDLDGIGAKMLSKDLHELEANQLITRTVLHTKPMTVEYEITEYGKSLTPVICEIISWGIAHRQRIMKG